MSKTDNDGSFLSPVLKRKPLPLSFTSQRDGSRSSALDEDTFPLVTFQNSATELHSPNVHYTDARFSGAGLQRAWDPAAYRHDARPDSFDISDFSDTSRQPSRSVFTDDLEDVHHQIRKEPSMTHDSLPLRSIPRAHARMWNSKWLDTSSLYYLIAIWLALLASLLVLWRFAVKENGLSTRITSNHYAWTYGPTAVLVIIGLALKKVDFNCRTLAPWHRLQGGLNPALTSLLLDYVSPILPRTLFAASINGDWAVVASSCSILILRLVIVFSTGLLVLTPTTISRTISDAVVNSSFVGTGHTPDLSTRSVEIAKYYGIQKYGLSYPYGTTDTVAYDTLDLGTIVPNATVSAAVNGVFPYFNCETVEPQVVQWTWEKDSMYPFVDKLNFNITLHPPQCPVVLLSAPSLCQPTVTECQTGQTIYYYNGWETTYLNFDNSPDNMTDLDPCSNLYFASITEFSTERVQGHLANTSSAWNITLINSVGLVCTVGYTVDLVNVTINTLDPSLPNNVNASGPLNHVMDVLPGYSHGNYTSDFQGQSNSFAMDTPTNVTGLDGVGIIAAYLSGGSARALLDPETFKTLAERVGKGAGAQLLDHHLRQTDDRKTAATMVFEEQRLLVRTVSLWAMCGGLFLLSVLTLVVLAWRPRGVVPRDPNSIATSAAILAGSRNLQTSLQDAGSLSDDQLQRHLRGTLASSRVANSNGGELHFFIDVASNGEGLSGPRPTVSTDSITWWRPMSTRFWFVIVMIVLSTSLIIVLEILQRISDTRNGIVDVSATSLVEHSLPSILASLVLISTAMMYDALYFAAATLPPYQAMIRRSAAAKSSICRGLSEGWQSLFKLDAFSSHSRSSSLALIATIIGSTLTIIGSGLYTVENVPVSIDVDVAAVDSFVPQFPTTTDGGAISIFNLMNHNNASYPALTYDELAFPNIDIASLGTDAQQQLQQSDSVRFQAKVPAIRATLNCTFVPQDTMVGNLEYYKTTTCPSTTVSFNASLPNSCPVFIDGNNGTATAIDLSYNAQFDCSDPSLLPAARGAVLSGSINTYLTDQGTYLGALSNPPGCPSLAFIYGYWLVNETSTANVTAMTCIQGLEEVHADAMFEVSGNDILIKSPPTTDESTSRWLTAFNNTYWFTKGKFEAFNENGSFPDYFYQAINYGPGGIPVDELVGPSNADLFLSATQHMYRRFMAQLISNTMRENVSAADASSRPKYPVTVLDLPRQRITQNATSKLILQIFLGVMLACAVLVYLLQDMRHVLPHSPWSIAGLMSLFTGSEMVERQIIPPGAEFMDDKELVRVFDGYMFSLGWWNASTTKAGDTTTAVATPTTHQNGLHRSMRFGIDIGNADVSSEKRRRMGRWWFWKK